MSSPRPACVLHLDVDAFFAAVEQRDHPSLRGRPVVVGTGVVASCSYESRPWGVRTGMRLVDARRLCPALVVLPGDYRRYELASRQILGICHETTPSVEMAALDDLYLDLQALSWDQAVPFARRLAAQVRQEVGLGVSLGIATNKLVAAVATQEVKDAKARGSTAVDLAVVPPGRERDYLAPWPVEILPGVGPRASAELDRLNVRWVRELAAMPLGVLLGLFGSRGRVLREFALGIDHRRVEPFRPAQSVSRCTSFDPPLSEMPILEAMLDHLLERAGSWLRLHDQATRGVLVRVRHADQRWTDSRVSLPRPEDDEGVLKMAARERLGRLCARRVPLRLLGVELKPLTSPDRQGELFPDAEVERKRRLRSCKDEIRERFGFMAVTSGTALELKDRLEHDRDNFRLRTPCLTR